MFAADTNWPAVTATPESVRCPPQGSVVILTAVSALAGLSAGIGEAEVGRGEGVRGVFERGDGLVGARRRIVDRGHVHGHRVGRGIEIDAAVGRAAVVLHLEGEAGVARAVGVGRRRELQVARRDVGHRHELAGGDRDAGQRQACPRPGSVVILTAVSALAGLSLGIGEAEVGRGEGVGRVFERGDRVVRARRRIVDRGDVHGHRVGRGIEIDAAVGRAAVVLHLEGEAGA